ncbi:MAG: hypothetical protein NC911_10320 [Candidatus Omnitrophica bacterium]|nr:hypothetical protein [Candidatus Omnitrophota bacterium]
MDVIAGDHYGLGKRKVNEELRFLREKIKEARPTSSEIAFLYSHENHCEFARNHHPGFLPIRLVMVIAYT